MFVLRTKEDMWGRHLGLCKTLIKFIFAILWYFIDQITDRIIKEMISRLFSNKKMSNHMQATNADERWENSATILITDSLFQSLKHFLERSETETHFDKIKGELQRLCKS